jgi:hypothetical protein
MELWLNPLIAAAAGVVGAAVGASATLIVSRREIRGAAERERHDALVGYYSAFVRLGHFYGMYAELMPAQAGRLKQLRNRVALSGEGRHLVERLFRLIDGYWAADARLRSVATPDELDILDGVEDAVAECVIGEALPPSWPAAARQLRLLVQAHE